MKEFPFYLGKTDSIVESDIKYCAVYKQEPKIKIVDGEEKEYLATKMKIAKENLKFVEISGDIIEVYSKIDPEEHFLNETSIIVAADSYFEKLGLDAYRVILDET